MTGPKRFGQSMVLSVLICARSLPVSHLGNHLWKSDMQRMQNHHWKLPNAWCHLQWIWILTIFYAFADNTDIPTGQVFNTLTQPIIFAPIYIRHLRKGIGIDMLIPRSVSNVHIILAQLFQPSRNLALGILEVKKLIWSVRTINLRSSK